MGDLAALDAKAVHGNEGVDRERDEVAELDRDAQFGPQDVAEHVERVPNRARPLHGVLAARV
jgi:hypothetical protein